MLDGPLFSLRTGKDQGLTLIQNNIGKKPKHNIFISRSFIKINFESFYLHFLFLVLPMRHLCNTLANIM